MTKFAPYIKAASAGVVALAAYLAGVIPAEGGVSDVSQVQWLGAIVTLGAVYGVTYHVPYHTSKSTPPVHAVDPERGDVGLILLVACMILLVLLALGAVPR